MFGFLYKLTNLQLLYLHDLVLHHVMHAFVCLLAISDCTSLLQFTRHMANV